MEKNSVKNFFLNILRGALMGIALIIPGFSGGTVAVVLGVYYGLVSAVLAAMIAQELGEQGRVIPDVIYSVIFFGVILSSLMSFRIEKGGLQWIGSRFFARHREPAAPAPAQQPAAAGETPDGQNQGL